MCVYPSLSLKSRFIRDSEKTHRKKTETPGATGWLSRLSVPLLTSTQVMMSWFVSSSPTLGSVLSAQSLLGILSPAVTVPPPLALSLSLKNK